MSVNLEGTGPQRTRARSEWSISADGNGKLKQTVPFNRTDITPTLASRLVDAQFPAWAGLPVIPVELGGWDNVTFRLGGEMSVRLPSADAYVEQIEKEHRWLPFLAPQLPLPIPQPLALGAPGSDFPRPWSIYRWIEGRHATFERIADLSQFATELAGFLNDLYRIDPAGGPPPGPHSFFRGGSIATYNDETREAIDALRGEFDTDAASDAWETALGAAWEGSPVWVHGDVAAGNLLVNDRRLSAVIDFGCSAVGDPACDLTIAWTFLFGKSREAFRTRLAVDGATWSRGRGWALWKATKTLVRHRTTNPDSAEECRRVIRDVLDEHKKTA